MYYCVYGVTTLRQLFIIIITIIINKPYRIGRGHPTMWRACVLVEGVIVGDGPLWFMRIIYLLRHHRHSLYKIIIIIIIIYKTPDCIIL